MCIFLCSRSLKPPEKHATFKSQDGLWCGQSVHSGTTIGFIWPTLCPTGQRDTVASFRAERDGCFCHFELRCTGKVSPAATVASSDEWHVRRKAHQQGPGLGALGGLAARACWELHCQTYRRKSNRDQESRIFGPKSWMADFCRMFLDRNPESSGRLADAGGEMSTDVAWHVPTFGSYDPCSDPNGSSADDGSRHLEVEASGVGFWMCWGFSTKELVDHGWSSVADPKNDRKWLPRLFCCVKTRDSTFGLGMLSLFWPKQQQWNSMEQCWTSHELSGLRRLAVVQASTTCAADATAPASVEGARQVRKRCLIKASLQQKLPSS